MRSINSLISLSLAIILCTSCGFDKLHSDIIADFYIKNDTGYSLVYRAMYYERETSQLPKDISLTIESGDCIAIYEGLVFSKSDSNEEILLSSLSGDIRNDTFAEIEIIGKDRVIRWHPNDSGINSIYSLSNWIIEDSFNSNKTTTYKSLTLIIDDIFLNQ